MIWLGGCEDTPEHTAFSCLIKDVDEFFLRIIIYISEVDQKWTHSYRAKPVHIESGVRICTMSQLLLKVSDF